MRVGRTAAVFGLLMCALGAEPAGAQSAEVRVVTLRVAVDEIYRGQPGWEATLRRTVRTVSDLYEANFQIRLAVRDVVPWDLGRWSSCATSCAPTLARVAPPSESAWSWPDVVGPRRRSAPIGAPSR